MGECQKQTVIVSLYGSHDRSRSAIDTRTPLSVPASDAEVTSRTTDGAGHPPGHFLVPQPQAKIDMSALSKIQARMRLA